MEDDFWSTIHENTRYPYGMTLISTLQDGLRVTAFKVHFTIGYLQGMHQMGIDLFGYDFQTIDTWR